MLTADLWAKGGGRMDEMAMRLTAEQERRVRALVERGGYRSVEEVLEAGVAEVERMAALGFSGARELDDLLAEGLASEQLSEEEFWDAVTKETDAILWGWSSRVKNPTLRKKQDAKGRAPRRS